jgi:hypothetical protein
MPLSHDKYLLCAWPDQIAGLAGLELMHNYLALLKKLSDTCSQRFTRDLIAFTDISRERASGVIHKIRKLFERIRYH